MSETLPTERATTHFPNETTPLKYHSVDFSSHNNKHSSSSFGQQNFHSLSRTARQRSQSFNRGILYQSSSYLPPLHTSFAHLPFKVTSQIDAETSIVEAQQQEKTDDNLLGSKLSEAPYPNRGSLALMIFINFLSNVIFSIVLPSLPTFVEAVSLSKLHILLLAVVVMVEIQSFLSTNEIVIFDKTILCDFSFSSLRLEETRLMLAGQWQ
jgi:hypothetical protein